MKIRYRAWRTGFNGDGRDALVQKRADKLSGWTSPILESGTLRSLRTYLRYFRYFSMRFLPCWYPCRHCAWWEWKWDLNGTDFALSKVAGLCSL